MCIAIPGKTAAGNSEINYNNLILSDVGVDVGAKNAFILHPSDYTNKYFKLTQNLTLNNGDSSKWDKDVSSIRYPWSAPIGRSNSYAFNGKFDGAGHTISGLYVDTETENGVWIGLFGKTGTGFEVKNLALTNSYMRCGTGASNVAYIGSIVGECQGSIDNVYSDAILVTAGMECGGIAGRMNGAVEHNFTNCWFNGNITTSNSRAGGLLGDVICGTLNMENCLNTGTVKSTYKTTVSDAEARVGSLIGLAWEPSSATVINMKDCIAAGSVSEVKGAGGIGTIIGSSTGAIELSYEDVYSCQDTYGYTLGGYSASIIITGHPITSSKNDRFVGYCYDAVEKDGLDFVSTWAVRTDAGVPVLSAFAEVAGVETVATSELDAQTGLSALGLSLENAENYGVGNYVLKVADDSSATKHNAYKTALEAKGVTVKVDNLAGLGGGGGVYNRMLTNADNSLCVNLTYVGRTETTYISISSGQELSPHMKPLDTTSNNNEFSFAMLPVHGEEDAVLSGNSFVMQLKNGHFIVSDGGFAFDAEYLVQYMKSKLPNGETPVVDAWFSSHLHTDHSMVFNGMRLYKEVRESIKVEAVYLNIPNENVIRNTDLDEGPARELPKQIESILTGIRMLKTTDDKTTKIYRCQTGHRYYFDGVTVDVVLAQEQLEFNCYDQNKYVGDFNTSSTALLFTTDTNHKIFTAGDSNESNTSYIMEAYGSTCPSILSNVNVFVAFHHGHNTVKSFTTWLKPNATKFDYVLFSSNLAVESIEDRIETEDGANTELRAKANQCYSFSDGLKTILNFTNSGITVTRE